MLTASRVGCMIRDARQNWEISHYVGKKEPNWVDTVAEVIAQAHEEELDDAQIALNAKWQNIQADDHATIAQLRRQVAMMTEALREVEWARAWTDRHGPWEYEEICPSCDAERGIDEHLPACIIAKALSSAPKVLWHGKTRVHRYGEGFYKGKFIAVFEEGQGIVSLDLVDKRSFEQSGDDLAETFITAPI